MWYCCGLRVRRSGSVPTRRERRHSFKGRSAPHKRCCDSPVFFPAELPYGQEKRRWRPSHGSGSERRFSGAEHSRSATRGWNDGRGAATLRRPMWRGCLAIHTGEVIGRCTSRGAHPGFDCMLGRRFCKSIFKRGPYLADRLLFELNLRIE